MKIWGSGALNVDYFFLVEELKAIEFRGQPLKPGREIWGDRRDFETLKDLLEQKGKFLGRCGGGSAANTIYALKNWGFSCGFIGIVGKDEEGDFALDELKGVNLNQVIRRGETSRSLIILDAAKDRAIFVCPHSEEKSLASFFPEQSKGWLHLSSFITDEGFEFHQRLAAQHEGEVSLDPGEIYASRGLSALKGLLKKTKLLFLTHQELALFRCSLGELLDLGPEMICLKKGAQGAAIQKEKKKIEIPPARPEKIVDNTGAGDVFDAGVIAGLKKGLSPLEAGLLAAALAASSLKDYGRLGYPSKDEFEGLLQNLKGENHGP